MIISEVLRTAGLEDPLFWCFQFHLPHLGEAGYRCSSPHCLLIYLFPFKPPFKLTSSINYGWTLYAMQLPVLVPAFVAVVTFKRRAALTVTLVTPEPLFATPAANSWSVLTVALVERPPLLHSICVLYRRAVLTVADAVPKPFFRSIGALNRWAVDPVQFPINPPLFRSIGVFHGWAVETVQHPVDVPLLFVSP